MDHGRLNELAAILLQESKSLLNSGDSSATTLTDPMADSGRPRAQVFHDSVAGDADYALWIRLLHLYSSASEFVERGEAFLPALKQGIAEVEELCAARANGEPA